MCYRCKKNTVDIRSIFRTTECPVCHADLHCCLNCNYYEPGSHFDCHESISEPVSDKEKANFCEYFKAKEYSNESGSNSQPDKAEEARKKLASLFGN